MLSRPSLDEVRDWRARVDEALERALPELPADALELVELGINHEQQHQELFLTDILATFAENPLEPAYGALDRRRLPRRRAAELASPAATGIGRDRRRRTTASPSTASGRATTRCSTRTRIANRRVTNGEWAEFIADGGYATPTLWLSDGWDWVQREGIERAALLARRRQRSSRSPAAATIDPRRAGRAHLLLRGRRLRPLGRRAAADRGRMGRRFAAPPTRTSATSSTAPAPSCRSPGGGLFGDVWQWTAVAFLPYPGFKPGGGRGRRI